MFRSLLLLGCTPLLLPGPAPGHLHSPLPQKQEKQEQAGATFSGLIGQEAAKMLKPVPKSQYAVGVLTSADAYARFAQAAKLPKKLDVDWQKQAVVCVVLQLNTNKLSLKQWSGPKDGAGELIIQWSGIEPFYAGRFPAVLHRVDKQGLKKVIVKVDPGQLLTEIDFAGGK